MLKKYDVIFSMGSACLCSQMLRRAGLQFCSYPFDWLAACDFSERIDFLVSDFNDFFNREDFHFTGRHNADEHNPCDVYKNDKTGIVFNHDFACGVPFDVSYPVVKAKYDRRINRLLNDIDRHKNILIVFTEVPPPPPVHTVSDNITENTNDDVLISGYNKIIRRFPNKNIDLLYIACAPDRSERQIGEHIFKLTFDYKNSCGIPPHDARVLRTAVKNYRLKRSLGQRIKNALFRLKKHLKNRRF